MSKSINLNPKEIEVLEVNLGDKVYKIPLGSSLTQKELKGLNKNENAEKFFIKYLGKEVWESLRISVSSATRSTTLRKSFSFPPICSRICSFLASHSFR